MSTDLTLPTAIDYPPSPNDKAPALTDDSDLLPPNTNSSLLSPIFHRYQSPAPPPYRRSFTLPTEDNRSIETQAEVDPYEEIVGDLDYSTPITSRSASPNHYGEDRSTVATFQGPITHSIESTVTSASAGLVASVPWPAL